MNSDRTKRSINFPDGLHQRIVERGTAADTFSDYVRQACRNWETIEERADSHPEELHDGWWEDAVNQYLEQRRERAAADDREREEELEAD